MSKYKHIIWDWNGTLIDDVSASIDAMKQVLKKRNLDQITKDRYMSIFGFPVKDYYTKIGFDFTKEPFECISDDFIEQYEKRCFSCSLHKEVKEVLAAFDAAGITGSILTASHQEYIEKCVRLYGIEKFFIKIVGLDNTHAHGKVENGKKLLEALPYKADEVVLIGDTEHDYEVSKEIGCQCILVTCGHHNEERLKKTGAVVLQSLREVYDYIVRQG